MGLSFESHQRPRLCLMFSFLCFPSLSLFAAHLSALLPILSVPVSLLNSPELSFWDTIRARARERVNQEMAAVMAAATATETTSPHEASAMETEADAADSTPAAAAPPDLGSPTPAVSTTASTSVAAAPAADISEPSAAALSSVGLLLSDPVSRGHLSVSELRVAQATARELSQRGQRISEEQYREQCRAKWKHMVRRGERGARGGRSRRSKRGDDIRIEEAKSSASKQLFTHNSRSM